MPWRGSMGEQQQWLLGSSHPPFPGPQAQHTKSRFMSSLAIGPRMSLCFYTCWLLQTAAQILMQYFPELVSSVISGGHMFWLNLHDGVPQLNLPKSGLFTFWQVPGIGPNSMLRLFPSTLLKSQQSEPPVADSVNSTKVAGDWPEIPLHSTPKALGWAPQSPVSHLNCPLIHLHPVLAQNLMATVLAATFKLYQVLAGISHPVLEIWGKPIPPTQIVWGQLLMNWNLRVPFQQLAKAIQTARMIRNFPILGAFIVIILKDLQSTRIYFRF